MKLTIPTPSVISNPISAASILSTLFAVAIAEATTFQPQHPRRPGAEARAEVDRDGAVPRRVGRLAGIGSERDRPAWTDDERVQLLHRRGRGVPDGRLVLVEAVVQQLGGLVHVDAVGVALHEAQQRVAARAEPVKAADRHQHRVLVVRRAALGVDVDAEAGVVGDDSGAEQEAGPGDGGRLALGGDGGRGGRAHPVAQRGGGPGLGGDRLDQDPVEVGARAAGLDGEVAAEAERAVEQRSHPVLVEPEEPDRLRREHGLVGHQVAEGHPGQGEQPPQPGRDPGRHLDVAERVGDRCRVGELRLDSLAAPLTREQGGHWAPALLISRIV